MASETILSADVIRRIAKELAEMSSNPLEGISISLNEEDITDVHASLDGPVGTPYEGGVFKMRLRLGSDFPKAPPKAFFITKIFHPNVSKKGEICVNTLKKDWKEDFGMKHILLTVKCLLIDPNPDSSLNEEAGVLFREQYPEYCKTAKLFTSIHAQKSEKSEEPSSSVNNENTSNNTPQATAAKVAEKKKAVEKKKTMKRL